MTIKKTPTLFPLKHEFYRSLDRFTREATNLAGTARTLLQLNPDIPGADILRASLDAFDNATSEQE